MTDFSPPDRCPICDAPSYGPACYDCDCGAQRIWLALKALNAASDRLQAFTDSLPQLYRSYVSQTPPSVTEGHPAALAAQALTPGQHLYLCGPNTGAGKTHLAVWTAARMVREHGLTALFVGEVKYFELLMKEFRGDGAAPDLEAPDVLVYDDFGKQKSTDFSSSRVYAMLEGRYSQARTYIITSNLLPGAASERVGESNPLCIPSVLSRLAAAQRFVIESDRDHRAAQ